MKYSKFFLLLFCLFYTITSESQSIDENRKMILWYRQPAKDWNEALPVGNGRLGAMVFGNPLLERIQLNEESIWAGMKVENADADAREYLPIIQQKLLNGEIKEAMELSEKHMRSNPMRIRSYQPLGDLYFEMFSQTDEHPGIDNYRRELNLENGIATTIWSMEGVTFTREVFASAPDDVIAIRITSSQPEKLTFKLSLSRAQDATVAPASDKELIMKGEIVDLPGREVCPSGLHMKFAALLWGKAKDGKIQTVNNSFFVENATEVIFFITAATDYNPSILSFDPTIDPLNKCASILKPLKNKSFDDVKADHISEHSAMFNRVKFILGNDIKADVPTDHRLTAVKEGAEDQGLTVLLFQYGRYMLMGSSRRPGILPANLQGIWNQDYSAAWNSDFHTNINIQMNYWPAEVCNLPETALLLSDFINRLKESGRITARKTYNSKGWTVNHLTDPFGRTSISDGVGWGIFPMAGPWLVLHQWEHYLFTQDRDYLKNEAWPTMKESAEFVMSFLIKDKKGQWVTAPSNSPENAYRLPNGEIYNLTYGATMDIQIVRELLNACINAAGIVGEDKRFVMQLKDILKDLPPNKVSKRYGIVQEWIEDYEENEPGHRHISQLFGLHPGTQITEKNPELFEAAKKTIERRQAYALKGQGSSPGWSKAWMVNFYARLKDGNAAWNKILELQRGNLLNNLFDSHPPFQIDGNFGLTAGIAEMLLQSHALEIEFLPALPDAWTEGSISGLKARGNIEVGIEWEESRLKKASLVSAVDQDVTVRYGTLRAKLKLKKGVPTVLDGSLKIAD